MYPYYGRYDKNISKFFSNYYKITFVKQKYFYNYKLIKNFKSHSISELKLAKERGGSRQRERDENRESTLKERLLAHLATFLMKGIFSILI